MPECFGECRKGCFWSVSIPTSGSTLSQFSSSSPSYHFHSSDFSRPAIYFDTFSAVNWDWEMKVGGSEVKLHEKKSENSLSKIGKWKVIQGRGNNDESEIKWCEPENDFCSVRVYYSESK